MAVADRLGVDEETRRAAEFGALLHDVGKVAIPNEIINKPGPLDDEEWAIMKTHTVEGQRMLERVGGLLARVGLVVRASHERYDGGGYPDGLAGEDIPLAARIVSACDAYNAMTTDRSYRKALTAGVAVAELRANSGTQFDPKVVEALVAVVDALSGRAAAAAPGHRPRGRRRAGPAPRAGLLGGRPERRPGRDGAVLLAYRVRDVERRGGCRRAGPRRRRRALRAGRDARQGPLRRGVARAAGARAGRRTAWRLYVCVRDAGQQALVDRRARRRRAGRAGGGRGADRVPGRRADRRKDPVVRREGAALAGLDLLPPARRARARRTA